MKRIHIGLEVSDLESSIRFYSSLFGQAPAVREADYAKWMPEDPKVNFSISTRGDEQAGGVHFGIQVEATGELTEVAERLEQAGEPLIHEADTVCCYHKSQKVWALDPDALPPVRAIGLAIDRLDHPIFRYGLRDLRVLIEPMRNGLTMRIREGTWGGAAVEGDIASRTLTIGESAVVRGVLVAETRSNLGHKKLCALGCLNNTESSTLPNRCWCRGKGPRRETLGNVISRQTRVRSVT